MISITKEFSFHAAHRLTDYDGLCQNIHGHTYKVEITIVGRDLKNGMLVDFSEVKRLVGAIIDHNMDHSVLVYVEDEEFIKFLKAEKMKHLIMYTQPTAENIAKLLLGYTNRVYNGGNGIRVESVRVYETPTSYATITRDVPISNKVILD